MFRPLHKVMKASVLCENGETSAFPNNIEVKQDCVIAPTLFSLFAAAILQIIIYRFDENFFNLRKLRAKTKVSQSPLVELQHA